MEHDEPSKRIIKRRDIFSPSTAPETEHSLIHVPEFHRDFLVKKSSLKYHSNGKISIKISGRESYGDLITSGTKSHCETELDTRVIEAERYVYDEASSDSDESAIVETSNRMYSYTASKNHKKGASATPHPRRTKLRVTTMNNSSAELNELHRSQSNVDLFHKLPSPYRTNTYQTKTNERSVVESGHDDEIPALGTSENFKVESRINKLLSSLNQKLDFVARKVQKVSQSAAFYESQIDIYRNEKDQFPEEVMWAGKNLLELHGKNPGDYGRQLLRFLFSENELKTSMLPSNISSRYLKPKLDEERFAILNNAMRVKYRINTVVYSEFYKNLVRKKLSDFLLEEERRDRMKTKRNLLRESTTTAAATTQFSTESRIIVGFRTTEKETSTFDQGS